MGFKQTEEYEISEKWSKMSIISLGESFQFTFVLLRIKPFQRHDTKGLKFDLLWRWNHWIIHGALI